MTYDEILERVQYSISQAQRMSSYWSATLDTAHFTNDVISKMARDSMECRNHIRELDSLEEDAHNLPLLVEDTDVSDILALVFQTRDVWSSIRATLKKTLKETI
ncbi:hypothetical protein [uncultured Actinomyces sp.]|uniref:hypothetical protein n=1 Tax=uncultured Actinomyces sp. TaxID=249061 RepID=UPI0028EB7267|nr:hypothetical protein [uncultured Actinomyces sp.]